MDKYQEHQFLINSKVVFCTLLLKNLKNSVNTLAIDICKKLFQFQKTGKLNKYGSMLAHLESWKLSNIEFWENSEKN